MSEFVLRPTRRAVLGGGLAVVAAAALQLRPTSALAVTGPVAVQLRTYSGFHWLSAAGAEPLTATATRPLSQETFLMTLLQGTDLQHGSQVTLTAQNGSLIAAEGGGGRELVANRAVVGPWEEFTLLRYAGPGLFADGDAIALRTASGQYVSATGGGGGAVVADAGVPQIWESLTARIMPHRHVRVEFLRVKCGNTEDVTGADEFYAVGSGKDRVSGQSTSAMSKPMSINDGRTKDFPFATAERVLFEDDVSAASTVVLACKFLDQDASQDWDSTYTALSAAIGGSITAVQAAAVLAGTATAGAALVPVAVLAAITAGVAALIRLDKDDVLGEHTFEVPAADFLGTRIETVRLRESGAGWSTWSYDIDLQITIS